MDHLLIPRQPTHKPIVVPYLCTEEHDGGLWVTYHYRKGIQDGDLVKENFWVKRYGILQNWLWFGPMRAFLGAKATHKAFTRKGDRGRLVLDTYQLSEHMHSWQSGWLNLSQDRKAVVEPEVVKILETWYSAYQAIICDDETGTLLLFSIAVLHEAFFNMWMNAKPNTSLRSLFFRSRGVYQDVDNANAFLWARMRKDGWCPQQLANLKMLPPSAKYYASLIDCPDPDRNHSHCSIQKCVAYGVPTTKHAKKGCKCAMVIADRGLMSSILLSGSFPLIRMEKEKRGKASLKIIKHVPGVKYIALSHLERLTALADQVYQAASIHDGGDELVDDIGQIMHNMLTLGDSTVYLWVDTICCPVASEFPAAHAKSLAMMPACYSQAAKVLVLDRYIESFPPVQKRFMRSSKAVSATSLERAMRIRFSRWTQRLWTLQEGALAKQLFIHFADGFYDFDKLMGEIIQSTLVNRGDVPEDLRTFHGSIRCMETPTIYAETVGMMEYVDRNEFIALAQQLESGLNRSSFGNYIDQISKTVADARVKGHAAQAKLTAQEKFLRRFARVCEAASTRSLNVSTDEPICLGTLLSLDVEALALTAPEKRMEKFWEMQPYYSRSLAHYHGEALEDTKGMDWAPASLINHANRGDLWAGLTSYSDKPAVRTEVGLHVPFPGAISAPVISKPLAPVFFFGDKSSGNYWSVTRKTGQLDQPFPPVFPRPMKAGLIFLSDTDYTAKQPLDPGKEESLAALLVLVVQQTIAFTYVLTGPLVELTYCGPRANINTTLAVLQMAVPEMLDSMQSVIEGSFVPGDHEWCISMSVDNS